MQSTYHHSRESTILTRTLHKAQTRKLKTAFNVWSKNTDKLIILQTEFEKGEKTLEIRSNEQNLQNLIDMSTAEAGHGIKVIYEELDQQERKNDMLHTNSICKIHSVSQNTNQYLKLEVIKQWKAWVKTRKLFKYWMKY